MNLVAYWFSDKIALASARRQADLRVGGAAALPDGPRAHHPRRPADAEAVHDPERPAERVRDRAATRSTRRSRSPSGITKLLSEDELRGVISHELGHVRNRDILTQSVASAIGAAITWIAYLLLWFGGDDDSPLGPGRQPGAVPAGADLGEPDPARDLAPARVLGRRHRRPDLRQPRVARVGAAAPRGGRQGDADAGQPGDRAALHREAVLGRRRSRACSPPTRRSRSASAASARCARRWASARPQRAPRLAT